MGSIHLADSSFYPLDPVIEKAFNNSDELAVEIDMSNDSILQEIAIQNEIYGMLLENESLDSILPKDLRTSLDSICISWHIPIGRFNRYKPWAAAMTLNSIGIMRLGYNYTLGIDLHFIHLANKTGKKIISLESVEDQVQALTGDGVPDSIGIYFMKKTMHEIRFIDSSISQMMQAWKNGDDTLFWNALNNMDTTSISDFSLQKEIDERIYYSRNRAISDSIEKMLNENRKVFVVIGAAHLVGEGNNIIRILSHKGFTIEQL